MSILQHDEAAQEEQHTARHPCHRLHGSRQCEREAVDAGTRVFILRQGEVEQFALNLEGAATAFHNVPGMVYLGAHRPAIPE